MLGLCEFLKDYYIDPMATSLKIGNKMKLIVKIN